MVALHGQISLTIDASATTDSRHIKFLQDLKELRIHLSVSSLMLKIYAAEAESVWYKHHTDYEDVTSAAEHTMAYERAFVVIDVHDWAIRLWDCFLRCSSSLLNLGALGSGDTPWSCFKS